MPSPDLYVFSGLPGTGKSSLARRLAQYRRAAYLRVDTVEAALLNAGHREVTVEGYAVEYALAEDNLLLGLNVVADCVNPLALTRKAWAEVARQAGSRLVNIEVVCSDVEEHRRRVDARWEEDGQHLPKWSPPDWDGVQESVWKYEVWMTPRLVLDTAHGTPQENFAALLNLLGEQG
ncbi:AAA family ATPase [Deinococcus budaensis]|uniref:Putative kinase n=1 Tax=Deinococcus budaensis TaxID=1665626 RepID=A0A7W8GFJ5_9DEIO|nr:putative kinase [Deinococcus budaensis]